MQNKISIKVYCFVLYGIASFFVRIDNDAFIFAKCYRNRSDQILLTRYSLEQTNLQKHFNRCSNNPILYFVGRLFVPLEWPFQPPNLDAKIVILDLSGGMKSDQALASNFARFAK